MRRLEDILIDGIFDGNVIKDEIADIESRTLIFENDLESNISPLKTILSLQDTINDNIDSISNEIAIESFLKSVETPNFAQHIIAGDLLTPKNNLNMRDYNGFVIPYNENKSDNIDINIYVTNFVISDELGLIQTDVSNDSKYVHFGNKYAYDGTESANINDIFTGSNVRHECVFQTDFAKTNYDNLGGIVSDNNGLINRPTYLIIIKDNTNGSKIMGLRLNIKCFDILNVSASLKGIPSSSNITYTYRNDILIIKNVVGFDTVAITLRPTFERVVV